MVAQIQERETRPSIESSTLKPGSRREQRIGTFTELSDPPQKEMPVLHNFSRWLRYVNHPVSLKGNAENLKTETSFK